MSSTIFIDGEAGTTGLNLRERLCGRDDMKLLHIDPERRKDESCRRELLNRADLAILCLPDEAARAAMAMIDNPTTRVLDASTAHRTASQWVYGFVDLEPGHRSKIAAASRVSNPGCYASGAIALIRPLRSHGLLDIADALTLYAISGYSGGGRQMIAAHEDKTAPPWKLYGLSLRHKHLAEIQHYGLLRRPPIFLPSVGAFRQGMVVMCPLVLGALRRQPRAEMVERVLLDHYRHADDIKVYTLRESAQFEDLTAEDLNHSNRMEIFLIHNKQSEHMVLVARLDNLGKGAGGAAAVNACLMLDLPSSPPA